MTKRLRKGILTLRGGEELQNLNKLLVRNGIPAYTPGDYKASTAVKVGNRRKLRKQTVRLELYRPGCTCCEPYFRVSTV